MIVGLNLKNKALCKQHKLNTAVTVLSVSKNSHNAQCTAIFLCA